MVSGVFVEVVYNIIISKKVLKENRLHHQNISPVEVHFLKGLAPSRKKLIRRTTNKLLILPKKMLLKPVKESISVRLWITGENGMQVFIVLTVTRINISNIKNKLLRNVLHIEKLIIWACYLEKITLRGSSLPYNSHTYILIMIFVLQV